MPGVLRRATAGWPRSTSRWWTRSRAELAGRLAPAEVFHEVLEHRWFLSEQAKRDVGTAEAAQSYFATVLPQTPEEVTTPVGDRGPGPGRLTASARARDPTRGDRLGQVAIPGSAPVRIDTPCELHHAPRTAVTTCRCRANGGDDRCTNAAGQRTTQPPGRPLTGARAEATTARASPAPPRSWSPPARSPPCGGDDGGASTLTWYINPDSGGQAEIASRCTEEAGGAVHDRGRPAAPRVAPSSASSSSAAWPRRTPRSTS